MDDAIDAPGFGDHRLHAPVDFGALGDVHSDGAHWARALHGNLEGVFLCSLVDCAEHPVAPAGERHRARESESGTSSRDEHDIARSESGSGNHKRSPAVCGRPASMATR